ncbi:class I SAM-dependent methyltransferase [bacterium]|nr:class I SAM-dependent methyltransferase [bacterium]
MKIKQLIEKKFKMLKNNPKTILYWGYKLANIFKKNTLNHGERYDPNIMQKFNIDDADQITRYYFANKIIPQNQEILDIACGTGYGTNLLSNNALKITGVDISKKAIKYANRHYKNEKTNFIISDIFSFNQTSDYVVSFETVEHIPSTILDTVKKLQSLARKGLIISVPYNEQAGHNKHHRHFNINEESFSFLNQESKIILYQDKFGNIYKNKKDCIDAQSLIILISANTLFNNSDFKSDFLKSTDKITPESLRQ